MAGRGGNRRKNEDTDLFDIDLDDTPIDPSAAEEAITKGLEAGLKDGLQKGAKSGAKPIAEEAAREAIERIIKGGPSSSVKEAIDNVAALYQTEALKTMVENMKKKTEGPISGAHVDPSDRFIKILHTAAAMGMDIRDLFPDKRTMVIAMTNPDMLPFIMMMGGGEGERRKKEDDPNDLLKLIMVMKMLDGGGRRSEPREEKKEENGSGGIAAIMMGMMEMMNRMYSQMAEMQEKMSKEKEQWMFRAIEPYMQQRSAADELEELVNRWKKFKELGIIGDGHDRKAITSPSTARYELELKKMAIDLEREKYRMQLEREKEMARMQEKEKQLQALGQLIGIGQRIINDLVKSINNVGGAGVNPAAIPGGNAGAVGGLPNAAGIYAMGGHGDGGGSITEDIRDRVKRILRKKIGGDEDER